MVATFFWCQTKKSVFRKQEKKIPHLQLRAQVQDENLSTPAGASLFVLDLGARPGPALVSRSHSYMRYAVSTDGHAAAAASLAGSLRAQWDAVPTGGLYSYPARLAPSAAELLLEELPRGTLLDPFCGSGTTLVEALRTGRRATGSDASPLALFVAGGSAAC